MNLSIALEYFWLNISGSQNEVCMSIVLIASSLWRYNILKSTEQAITSFPFIKP